MTIQLNLTNPIENVVIQGNNARCVITIDTSKVAKADNSLR